MKLNLHPKGIPKQEPLGADTPLKKGGVVVGMRKEGDKEKIYFVGDDCHLLCVGATRSGKSRCLVLESICLLGLAGESIFCSDPKAELFHYTADFLKKLGYEVLVLDFKNPEKSMRYNLLQPIIDAISEGDTDRAEMLAWDLTNNLVGKPEGEKIWTNGECSIIAAAILCVVCDNQKRPEFQNMTNVYWFISEMCRTIGNKMPLLEYVKKLSPSHPARALLSISDVAPSRTRGSFYTSALTTLRLFTSKSIYAITHTSDFTFNLTCYIVCDNVCIKLRLLHLEDIDLDVFLVEFLQLFLQFVNILSTLTNDDTRTSCADCNCNEFQRTLYYNL